MASRLQLDFTHKIVLDVGASTGGFSDFALQHGAAKVYAVDVGSGQLDPKIRHHPRTVVMERTDIRDVEQLPEAIDLAVVDVSFISLKLVLPHLPKLLKPTGQILAMVKPQFETDRPTASLHKGVIKNDTLRRQILKDFETWVKKGFRIVAKADSAVSGLKGNRERFYLLNPFKR